MEPNGWEQANELAKRHEETTEELGAFRVDEPRTSAESASAQGLVEAAKKPERAELALEADRFFRDQMTYLRGVFVALGADDAVIQRVSEHLEEDYRIWHGSQFAGEHKPELSNDTNEGPQLRLGM